MIHVVATIEHVSDDRLLGVFFALVGAGQLYAGWRIYRQRYDLRLLKVVAVANVAIALLWALSRTAGQPLGPEAGRVSAVGVADTIATLQELAFAVIVIMLIRATRTTTTVGLAEQHDGHAVDLGESCRQVCSWRRSAATNTEPRSTRDRLRAAATNRLTAGDAHRRRARCRGRA